MGGKRGRDKGYGEKIGRVLDVEKGRVMVGKRRGFCGKRGRVMVGEGWEKEEGYGW